MIYYVLLLLCRRKKSIATKKVERFLLTLNTKEIQLLRSIPLPVQLLTAIYLLKKHSVNRINQLKMRKHA